MVLRSNKHAILPGESGVGGQSITENTSHDFLRGLHDAKVKPHSNKNILPQSSDQDSISFLHLFVGRAIRQSVLVKFCQRTHSTIPLSEPLTTKYFDVCYCFVDQSTCGAVHADAYRDQPCRHKVLWLVGRAITSCYDLSGSSCWDRETGRIRLIY